jgi:hypothetical protein
MHAHPNTMLCCTGSSHAAQLAIRVKELEQQLRESHELLKHDSQQQQQQQHKMQVCVRV